MPFTLRDLPLLSGEHMYALRTGRDAGRRYATAGLLPRDIVPAVDDGCAAEVALGCNAYARLPPAALRQVNQHARPLMFASMPPTAHAGTVCHLMLGRGGASAARVWSLGVDAGRVGADTQVKVCSIAGVVMTVELGALRVAELPQVHSAWLSCRRRRGRGSSTSSAARTRRRKRCRSRAPSRAATSRNAVHAAAAAVDDDGDGDDYVPEHAVVPPLRAEANHHNRLKHSRSPSASSSSSLPPPTPAEVAPGDYVEVHSLNVALELNSRIGRVVSRIADARLCIDFGPGFRLHGLRTHNVRRAHTPQGPPPPYPSDGRADRPLCARRVAVDPVPARRAREFCARLAHNWQAWGWQVRRVDDWPCGVGAARVFEKFFSAHCKDRELVANRKRNELSRLGRLFVDAYASSLVRAEACGTAQCGCAGTCRWCAPE